MKIRFWLLDGEDDPTPRHRGVNVYNRMQELGINADKWNQGEQCDIIVVQYDYHRLEIARKYASHVIFDCNDMTWKYPNDATEYFLGRVTTFADYITCGSAYLAAHLQGLVDVPCSYITEPADVSYDPVQREPDGKTIFWMGMPHNICYFSHIVPEIHRICTEYGMQMVCLCTKEDRKQVEEFGFVWEEWSIENARKWLSVAEIGVCPYFQNIWCWSKCASKAAIMMTHGIPVVATSIPSYRDAIVDGESGMLASSPDDWYSKLRFLAGSMDNRVMVGEAGRERALKMFTVDRTVNMWKDVIYSVTGKRL